VRCRPSSAGYRAQATNGRPEEVRPLTEDVAEIENLYAQLVIQTFDDLREEGDGSKYISRNYLDSGDFWIPYFCSLLEGVRQFGCVAGSPSRPQTVDVLVPDAFYAVHCWAKGSLDDFGDDVQDSWHQRAFNLNLKRFLDNVYLRGDRTLTAFVVALNSFEIRSFCLYAGMSQAKAREVENLAMDLSLEITKKAMIDLIEPAAPIKSRMIARLYEADARLTKEDGS
jgi:hypothetical protein